MLKETGNGKKFPDTSQTFTLKKGEMDFTLNIGIGNFGGSGGQVTSLGSVNYATTLNTSTDEFYNYKQTMQALFIGKRLLPGVIINS